jgi:hypothetical protein
MQESISNLNRSKKTNGVDPKVHAVAVCVAPRFFSTYLAVEEIAETQRAIRNYRYEIAALPRLDLVQPGL